MWNKTYHQNETRMFVCLDFLSYLCKRKTKNQKFGGWEPELKSSSTIKKLKS